LESSVTIGGKYILPLAQGQVWNLLNDPVVLQHCIKGCDQVLRDDNGNFHAQFRFRAGPIKKQLVAKLIVEETDPPACYQLSSTVFSPGLGAATGCASVYLDQFDAGTRLEYHAEISVEGLLSRLGEGVLRAAAGRYMQLFFDRFVSLSNQHPRPVQ
jgi:carbon monoxide dehydrogenase subunit G